MGAPEGLCNFNDVLERVGKAWFEVGKKIGEWWADIGITGISLTTGGTGAGAAAVIQAERAALKEAFFKVGDAKFMSELFKWGQGYEGVQAAWTALDATRMETIKATVTQQQVSTIQKFYEFADFRGKAAGVASERAEYMKNILRKW